jgi:hypothetical protein
MLPFALAGFLSPRAGATLKRIPIKTSYSISVAADCVDGGLALEFQLVYQVHVLVTPLNTIESSNRCHTVPVRQACG